MRGEVQEKSAHEAKFVFKAEGVFGREGGGFGLIEGWVACEAFGLRRADAGARLRGKPV